MLAELVVISNRSNISDDDNVDNIFFWIIMAVVLLKMLLVFVSSFKRLAM